MTSAEEKKRLLLLNIVWAALLLWLALNCTADGYRDTFTVCPTKLFFSIPCPSCGVTRAFLLAAHGHFAEALRMNINVVLLVPAYIAFPLAGIAGAVLRKNLQQRMLDAAGKLLRQWWIVLPLAVFEIAAEALNLYHHFTLGMP
ncbi:MAG: DUF2752 domain-containing protein [Prevotella sp.]|uniref:DUF2752 domain-containing protein n=1 Tax=Prevotella sp. TaxID=59823 RepID=UPI002A259544|nr:DUF2752 domain-containing protein [Prevotella sp.]MDD7317302.1 DUF2752 domain-containing protein [Prevotellaceae bacterium]MDY4019906.1 DUF2752 domain-containing protein [Prevotella sp.]